MQQLSYVLVWVDALIVCVLWGAVLYKLYPLYKAGVFQGHYRTLFRLFVPALAWVSLQVVGWLYESNDKAMLGLTIAWAIGILLWASLSAVRRTRRATLRHDAGDWTEPQAPRRVDGYTVRTTPATAGRSARAQAAQRKAVRP